MTREQREELRDRVLLCIAGLLALLALSLGGCSDGEDRERLRADRAEAALAKALNCADEAVLLASTAGSPDEHRCSNAAHVIEATVVSAGSEEVGAAVVCRCPRGTATPDGGAK